MFDNIKSNFKSSGNMHPNEKKTSNPYRSWDEAPIIGKRGMFGGERNRLIDLAYDYRRTST